MSLDFDKYFFEVERAKSVLVGAANFPQSEPWDGLFPESYLKSLFWKQGSSAV